MRRGTSLPLDWHQPPLQPFGYVAALALGITEVLLSSMQASAPKSASIRYARTLLKQPALSAGHRHLYDYPTPSHLNVLWEFGSLGGIGLHVQIVTGIVLAMHYTPHVVCAAVSIEHILREVYAGHILRHAHANGASLFFIAV